MDEWLAKLESGDAVRAWDAFLDRYRNLILATLRRYVDDPDDLMDAFAEVCVTLRADDLSRLRRFVREQTRGARVSTWLVAVTRNRAIDWVRKRDGRIRPSAGIHPSSRDVVGMNRFESRTRGTWGVAARWRAAVPPPPTPG